MAAKTDSSLVVVDTLEETPEILQTWKKIETISKQTGLRDGISDGRNSNFQESFDIGYSNGFKNGYLLGKCKGIVLYQQQQGAHNLREVITDHPEKITRGDCIICKQPNLLEEDVEEITTKQENIFKENEKVLQKLENTCVKEKT